MRMYSKLRQIVGNLPDRDHNMRWFGHFFGEVPIGSVVVLGVIVVLSL